MKASALALGFIGAWTISLVGLPSFDALAESTPSTAKRASGAPAAKPRKSAKAKSTLPKTSASKLDLTVRDLPDPKLPTPEDPKYASSVLSGDGGSDPDAGTTPAERSAAAYKTEPLFQSDQKLQILDAEVPVSVKLGKWKTSEESKALGLSATVPLKVLE